MPVFHRKPVFVPVDYSVASLQAVRVAKSVAGAGSYVTVVHVAQDYDLTLHPLTWTGGPLPNYPEERLLQGLRNWDRGHNFGDVKLAVRTASHERSGVRGDASSRFFSAKISGSAN